MAPLLIQQRLTHVSALTLGCLITLYSSFSASSFANAATNNDKLNDYPTVLLSEAADSLPQKMSSDTSIDTKREILQKALAIANSLENPTTQQNQWLKIATAYIEIGEDEQAKALLDEVSREIDVDQERLLIFSYIRRIDHLAGAYIAIGDEDTAAQLMEEAIAFVSDSEVITDISKEPSRAAYVARLRTEAIAAFSDLYGRFEQVSVAQKGLLTLTDLAIAAKEEGHSRGSLLTKIATGYAQLSDRAIANQGIDQIAAAVQPVESTFLNLSLAESYFDAGNDEAAHALLEAVIRSVPDENSDENTYVRGGHLARAARLYGRTSNVELAEQQLEKLLSMTKKLENKADAIEELSGIALAYQAIGDIDKAHQVIDLVPPIAEDLAASDGYYTNLPEGAMYLPELIITYEQLQLPVQQQEAIDRFYTVFVETDDPVTKALTARILYQLYPKASDEAAPVYLQALVEHAKTYPNSYAIAENLRWVADAALLRGDAEAALPIIDEVRKNIAAAPVDDSEKIAFIWASEKKAFAYAQLDDIQLAQQRLEALEALSAEMFEVPERDVQISVINAYLTLASRE